MATITLSTDAYFVSNTTLVDQQIPLILTGTVANTYVMPGAVTVPAGATFPGYQVGSKFYVINTSTQTQTFSQPVGYTLLGVTSLTHGDTTPTVATFYYIGSNQWLGVTP